MFKEENKKKTEYAIDHIPFIEFMKIHNFRDCHDAKDGSCDNDTKIIRIYYGGLVDKNCFRDKYNWFEFGIYNFGLTSSFVESLNRIFSKDILNSYVDSFCVNSETGILEVWLTDEPGDLYDD